jgi:serine acetyltransferase
MANVGSQTTIGAGAVVVKDIPSGVVAVGVPAKPVNRSVIDSVRIVERSG